MIVSKATRCFLWSLCIASVFGLVGCGNDKATAASSENDLTAERPHEAASTAEHTRDPNRLWCGEHDVYEDECVICHPELAERGAERDPNRLWCAEHNVYEDECHLCHPELAAQDSGRYAAKPHESHDGVLWCNEHNFPERECGVCQPQLLRDLAPGQGVKVRLGDPDAAFRAGIEVGHAVPFTTNTGGTILGKVSYNRNALAMITPLAEGVLGEILVDVGDEVDEGQILAWVNAPSIAQAKNHYIQALADQALKSQIHAREKNLADRNISARQDFEQARAALEVSQAESAHGHQRLLDLGLTEAEIADVARSRSTTSLLPVRAPFAGTIVDRTAVQGAAVETGVTIFNIADLSTMWMELSVPENVLGSVAEGTPLTARFDAFPDRSFDGEIVWVAYSVDEETRSIQARATVENPARQLRHGMFGRATLARGAAEATMTLSVPQPAVQTVEGRPVVFARVDDSVFEARVVQLGPESAGNQVILAGIRPEDTLVVRESYLLKSELLKARLGAGCTDH